MTHILQIQLANLTSFIFWIYGGSTVKEIGKIEIFKKTFFC